MSDATVQKTQRTLVMFKPDLMANACASRAAQGMIVRDIGTVVAAKICVLEPAVLERHYAEHKGKHFYNDLITFMGSGPSLVMIVEGPNAIRRMRELLGATSLDDAQVGTLRDTFRAYTIGTPQSNIAHASADRRAAPVEIGIHFP